MYIKVTHTKMVFITSSIIAVITCMMAAIFDFRTKRIPNFITFPAMIAGVLLTTIFNIKELPFTLLAMVVWFFIGAIGIAGLGDIKLLMAITAIGGWGMSLCSIIIGSLILAAYACITNPFYTYYYSQKWLSRIFKFKKIDIDKQSKKCIFAPALLLGIIFYILFINDNGILNKPFSEFISKNFYYFLNK